MDYLGSNSCTLFINNLDINNIYNIDKTQNYFFFSFFFLLHIYTFTGSFKDINVNLVKVASCSCVHSFLHGCLQVRKWNIKFGMGMCRFGMEHCAQRKRLGGTANWLLVAVRTLVAVSRAYLSRLPCPARSWRGSTYLDCPALLTHGEGLPI